MGANATRAESLAFGWRGASTFDRVCAAGARRSSLSFANLSSDRENTVQDWRMDRRDLDEG
jgi:hypothetical protein